MIRRWRAGRLRRTHRRWGAPGARRVGRNLRHRFNPHPWPPADAHAVRGRRVL